MSVKWMNEFILTDPNNSLTTIDTALKQPTLTRPLQQFAQSVKQPSKIPVKCLKEQEKES